MLISDVTLDADSRLTTACLLRFAPPSPSTAGVTASRSVWLS